MCCDQWSETHTADGKPIYPDYCKCLCHTGDEDGSDG